MREAHVPAQQPETEEDTRFPRAHAHPRRPGRDQGPAPAGPFPALGLILPVRARATFQALSRARRRTAGVVTLRFVPGAPGDEPRLAVATGRTIGNAVTRNRVRRRLRAAVMAHRDDLVGGAYLVGGSRAAATVPFAVLRGEVGDLLRMAREEA
jgi:ribonuclease P protein component